MNNLMEINDFQAWGSVAVRVGDSLVETRNQAPMLKDEFRKDAESFKGIMFDDRYSKMGIMGISQKTRDSGQAFLIGELEKYDAQLYKPFNKYYWMTDMPIRTGGGAVDSISFISVNWGDLETNNGYVGGNSNVLDTISADVGKELGKVRMWAKQLRIGYKDMLQSNQIGRPLEELLVNGINVSYNKELDRTSMLGWEELGLPGLYNNTDISASLFTNGDWANSVTTPDEILEDVNEGISEVWANVEFDNDGLPDTLLLTPTVFGALITRKVSDAADKSILNYILDNNLSQANGVTLAIRANRYGIGAGAASASRSIFYRNNDQNLRMHLTVPLTRAFTSQSADQFAYLTPYYAFISQPEFVKLTSLNYKDGA